MRRFLLQLIALVCLVAPSFATVTVSGHAQDASGGAMSASGFVRFELRGCNGNIPRVVGTTTIVPSTYDFHPTSGVISGAIYANSEIQCPNGFTPTYWHVTWWPDGVTPIDAGANYTITSNFNLDSAVPNTTNPVVLPPTGDGTYARLDGGNSPFTAPISVKALNNVRYADQFAGADLGAKIMAAAADLPSSGKIVIPEKADGSCWLLSTPVTFSTLGKYITLEGLGNGGDNDLGTYNACVIVTRTVSGFKAFTYDNAANKNGTGHNPNNAWIAMRNLTFANATVDGGSTACVTTGGCGSQAVLVDCADGTNSGGCYEASFENVSATGFGKVFSDLNNYAVQVAWRNSHFQANTQIAQLGGGASGQQLSGMLFDGGQWAGNGAGLVASSGTTPEVRVNQLTVFGTVGLVFDWTAAAGGQVELVNSHLEQGLNTEIASGTFDFMMTGGVAEWDNTGGTHDWMFNVNGGKFILFGTGLAGPGGACPGACLSTGILNANSGSARGLLIPYLISAGHFGPSGTDVLVAGSQASKFTTWPLNAASGAAKQWAFESQIFAPSFEVGTGAGWIVDEDGAPPCITGKDVVFGSSFSPNGLRACYNNDGLGFGSIPTINRPWTWTGAQIFAAQVTSTVATGTAPFSVASTTVVPNLNVGLLNGATFAAPGPIGSTTPSTGQFTTLQINGGATIQKHLSATASLDFGATAASSCEDKTMTVTGAADGDVVSLGVPNALGGNAGVSYTGFVSAANTVTVRRCNVTTGAASDPAAQTVRADVWQH